jgi:ATP synthase protein I
MPPTPMPPNHRPRQTGFLQKIAHKQQRRLRGRQNHHQSTWLGLGLMGLVGWSVAVPTLLGMALGSWIDRHFPSQGVSWTLMLLLSGLGLGCLSAWFWVAQEQAEIEHTRGRTDRPPTQPSIPNEPNHD